MSYFLLIVAAAFAVVVFELRRSLGIYRRFRGDRIIRVPKTVSRPPCASLPERPRSKPHEEPPILN